MTTTDDRRRGIDGADFVIVQLRVGGQAARHVDETLPVGYGCLGQETTGPGGLAKALRTVPLVVGIAEETADHGATGAWLVDFTNPVGIVTQALADEGHRALGLCNVAIHAQRRLGHYLGVDPDTVAIEHVGLNHLTWVRSATVGGVDRLGEALDRFGPELELESGVPIGLLRLLGALPSYYLHYYYCLDEFVAEQSVPGWRSRAQVVADLETELLEEYRDPALVTKPDKLSWRGGAFYSEAAVRLIASLHADTGDVQVVDVVNDGAMAGCRGRRGRGPLCRRCPGSAPGGPAPAPARHGRAGGPRQGLRAPGRRGRPLGEPVDDDPGVGGEPHGGPVPAGRAAGRRPARRQPWGYLPRFFPAG